MTPDDTRLAALVEPRFRLGPPLGAGAFSRVHRAYDREARCWRALKHGAHVDRLEAEGERLARVRSDHVVRSHGLLNGGHYGALCLELVPGPDALSYVRGDGPRKAIETARRPRRNLPMAFGAALQEEGTSGYVPLGGGGLGRLRHVLRGALQALQAVHHAGLVHLDLHAGNLRVSEGRPVLLDFDGARAPGRVKDQAATAHALAPELAEGRAVPASDLYALGVMLFEALTGRAPFEGGGPAVLVHKLTVEAPRVRDLVAEVPPELDALAAGLLARAPGRRPSAAEAEAMLLDARARALP